MTKIKFQCLSLGVLFVAAGCTSSGLLSTSEDDDSFELAVSEYSEEALGQRPADGSVIAVGSAGCEIDDDLRDEFDALLPITDAKADDSEARHAPFGLPIIEEDNGLEFILHHNEYLIGYNADLLTPVYASYRLDREDIVKGDRRDCFREDHRLELVDRSTLDDYLEPVFDQGHLVPVGDMHREFSTSVNTFYLSNMMPQSARFNRGVWKFLEGSTRMWADRLGSVLVLSGPIFDRNGDAIRDAEADAKRIRPQRRVAQPTHFFKIIIHENEDGELESMTYLLPHSFTSVGGSAKYIKTKFATIDEVEAITGYDFFPDLPSAQENELESFQAEDFWRRK